MDYRYGTRSVYGLQYHFVFVTEGRKNYIDGNIADFLKDDFTRLIEKMDGKMLNISMKKDHVHIVAELSPKLSLQDTIGVLKGCTSRNVKKRFCDELEKLSGDSKLPFWCSSYFVATSGEISQEAVRDYVEQQGLPKRPKGRPSKNRNEN